jgi:hypothetical protein
MAGKLQEGVWTKIQSFSGDEMKKLSILLCFAMMCAMAANADVIATGAGTVTGSWTQAWIWQGTTITSFEFDMLPGSAWEHPIHDFSNGWTATGFSSTVITGAGAADVNFGYSTDFVTNMNQPLSYRWYGFSGSTVIDQGVASWDGSSWSYVSETATPEPASLILLGSGLLGIGSTLRKKFQA